MKKFFKIFGIILASIVGFAAVLLLLLVIGLNAGAHIKFKEFYSVKENIAKNPGLWDNFVPQGLTYNDDMNYYASCGYMKDGSTSRIYTVKNKKEIKMYELTSEGKPYTGHTGGLQYVNGIFYLASEGEGLFTFSSQEVNESSSIEIGSPVKVNNNSSFCFADQDYVYVGEFAHVPVYPCDHNTSFQGQEHTAIMAKYKHGEFDKPEAVYAIPDEVQGVGISDKGTMIFSRSWGVTFASYDIYKTDKIVDTGMKLDGAPLYFLTQASHVIDSPYFTEDIDIVDGKLISMTEAAANKYYIGKFIFDFNIFAFNLSDID
ncbi:MAG: hypothetical protein K5839_05265 [Treponemataceae bacterium]|nr:hypothetical protein [Treponemataceae bacterium]